MSIFKSPSYCDQSQSNKNFLETIPMETIHSDRNSNCFKNEITTLNCQLTSHIKNDTSANKNLPSVFIQQEENYLISNFELPPSYDYVTEHKPEDIFERDQNSLFDTVPVFSVPNILMIPSEPQVAEEDHPQPCSISALDINGHTQRDIIQSQEDELEPNELERPSRRPSELMYGS